LIPFVLITPIIFEISRDSITLEFVLTLTIVCLISIGTYRIYYRNYVLERVLRYKSFDEDEALKQRWRNRIKQRLQKYNKVITDDFFDAGYRNNSINRQEIDWAIEDYFEEFELSERLSLIRKERRIPFSDKNEYYWVLSSQDQSDQDSIQDSFDESE
jgi:hypothetical protein